MKPIQSCTELQSTRNPLPYLLGLAALLPHVGFSQLIETEAFLQGDFVEAGITQAGYFGSTVDAPAGYHPRPRSSGGGTIGFVVDRNKTGWTSFDGDFFLPGNPYEGWGLTIGDTNFFNTPFAVNIPGNLSEYTEASNNQSVAWTGELNGLSIEKLISVPKQGQFIRIDVTLTNTGDAPLSDVYYARGFDPDNNQTVNGSFRTRNTVETNPPTDTIALVSSTQSDSGGDPTADDVAVGTFSYVALVAIDSRARAGLQQTPFGDIRAADFWNGTRAILNGTNFQDTATCLSFRFDSIPAGGSVSFTYFYALSLEATEEEVDDPDFVPTFPDEPAPLPDVAPEPTNPLITPRPTTPGNSTTPIELRPRPTIVRTLEMEQIVRKNRVTLRGKARNAERIYFRRAQQQKKDKAQTIRTAKFDGRNWEINVRVPEKTRIVRIWAEGSDRKSRVVKYRIRAKD